MVTNRYKSSPVVAHGTRTKLFGARFRLFTTIHSVSENEIIRHFSLSHNYETYADRFVRLCVIKYLHFARVVDDAKCIVVTRVGVSVCLCVSVCVSVRGRTPTILHGSGCNLGAW